MGPDETCAKNLFNQFFDVFKEFLYKTYESPMDIFCNYLTYPIALNVGLL